jgi:branched-chain amino acid transport system permease protein
VILAMAAVSLNLIMGFGGMVSFGHAAYLGIGGYVVGILAKEGVNSGFLQWPLALAVSALFALVVGALSLRTRGVYFIMITLAFAQMIYYVAIGLDRYGGDDGMTIYKRSQFATWSTCPTRRRSTTSASSCCSRRVTWSGASSIRASGWQFRARARTTRRMRAIGFPTYRYKLTCFVIAGTLCGLAGALLANHTDFISPAIMHWTRSGDLIVMAVLGGMGTVLGPVLGAGGAALVRGGASGRHSRQYLAADRRRRRGQGGGVLADRAGTAVPAGRAVRARWHRRGCWRVLDVAEALLKIDGFEQALWRRRCVRQHHARYSQGELHAIIGPNGAGKTTLITQLAGELSSDAGASLRRRDITALPTYRRSQLGLARSFQITSLFLDFTALDNVALAVQAHAGHSFHFWRGAQRGRLARAARAALARVGLADRERRARLQTQPRRAPAARDRHGAATSPRMLLLDEPMAEWDRMRVARMVELLRELKRELTILLIEHDMEAVFALADRITVLVYGRDHRIRARRAIRANAEVRRHISAIRRRWMA